MENETNGNNNDKLNYLPMLAADDPNSIESYIKKGMDFADVLVAMKERQPCFIEAQYNASNKEMLCLYMLLDTIEELIHEMRKDNKCFKQTTKEGLRAIFEVLPDYVVAELIEETIKRKGKQ